MRSARVLSDIFRQNRIESSACPGSVHMRHRVGRWERRVKLLRDSFAALRPFGWPVAPSGSEGSHGRKRASGHGKAGHRPVERSVSHMCINQDTCSTRSVKSGSPEPGPAETPAPQKKTALPLSSSFMRWTGMIGPSTTSSGRPRPALSSSLSGTRAGFR